MAVALAMSACVGERPATTTSVPPASPAPTVVSAAPPALRDGGAVVVARAEEASSFMPYTGPGSSRAARELWSATLPSLTSLAVGTPVESATEVRVRIRPDARWSDGVPITPGDVAFTWRLVVSESFPAWSRTGFDRIVSVEADGPTAVVRFSTPFPRWRLLFDPVLPQHRLRNGPWSGLPDISGGPFRFAGWEPGLSVTLERNVAWWGTRPHLDRVVFLLVPDAVTQRHLFREGKVDVLSPPVDTRAGPLLEELGRSSASATGRRALALVNLRRFRERDLRESLLGALPAAELAESVLKDEATPILRPPLPVAEGLTGTAVSISFPEEVQALGLLARAGQRRLMPLGASVDLRARESKRFWDEWIVPADIDVALVESYPAEAPWCFVTATDACGTTGWSDPAALDGDPLASAERARAVLPLWEEVERVVARDGLTGVRLGSGSSALTAHLAEWAWAEGAGG